MTTFERALQIYQVLIGAAHNRQVLSYRIVGELVGLPQQGLAAHLGHIMRFCERNGLPPLTVVVVRTTSGEPGEGLTTVKDLNADREAVFSHPWYRMRPVNFEDFASTIPDNDFGTVREQARAR